jgi:hypothetical protein
VYPAPLLRRTELAAQKFVRTVESRGTDRMTATNDGRK